VRDEEGDQAAFRCNTRNWNGVVPKSRFNCWQLNQNTSSCSSSEMQRKGDTRLLETKDQDSLRVCRPLACCGGFRFIA
jgi:hypothetical protein